jgi:ATP-dependent DNA helicase RecG
MVMKTVAAFANSNGGSIFFGINNRYEVIGLKEEIIPKFQDTLSDLIDDWVNPAPTWAFDLLPVSGARSKAALELIVVAGDHLPYAVGTMARSLRYYVGHGGRSLPARPDEVRAPARSRPLNSDFVSPFHSL